MGDKSEGPVNSAGNWQCAWCGRRFGRERRPKHEWGRAMWFCSDYCKNGQKD